jgi:hydrogenase maturation protease
MMVSPARSLQGLSYNYYINDKRGWNPYCMGSIAFLGIVNMLKTAILGFGNPVRSDDAVGCHVIELLKREINIDQESISLIDMGTSAFEVLFHLKGHQRIIIIDGVINTDEPDGTLFKLPAEEIDAQIQDDPMVFLHSLKWDQALSYSKKILGDTFPEGNIDVYLIAISNIKLDVGMSKEVEEAAIHLADRILEDVLSKS